MAKHLVVGPPGTGKTRFGIELVKEAIAKDTPSDRILYASFTRSASYEARRRAIEAFPGLGEDDFPYFRTIHSIAFRLLGLNTHAMFDGRKLKEFANAFKYKFSDDALDKDLFQQDMIDMSLGTDADTYLAFDDWRKNRLLLDIDAAISEFTRTKMELPREFNPKALKLFLERKEEYKAKEGLWEFSDLLLKVHLDKMPLDVDFVVCDEAQDNSPLLHAVIETWARNAKEVYLIGDPDQAIYTFMGSDPSLMIDWKRDEDIVLKQSYRCGRAVHDLSRKVIDRMKFRYHSDFLPTSSEGTVSRASMPNLSFDGGGTTFWLARTRYLMEEFYDYLLLKGIPFTVRRGKQGPLDKKVSESVHSLYSLAEGGYITIQNLHRILKFIPQEPYLKRGAKTEIADKARESPEHKISKVSLPFLGFSSEFVHLLDSDEYTEVLKASPEEKRYYRLLLKNHGARALTDEPKVQLGTIHSAKGLEADTVILSTEMTRLPYENLISGDRDSEHRVFYTAITRAKNTVKLLPPETWRCYPL